MTLHCLLCTFKRVSKSVNDADNWEMTTDHLHTIVAQMWGSTCKIKPACVYPTPSPPMHTHTYTMRLAISVSPLVSVSSNSFCTRFCHHAITVPIKHTFHIVVIPGDTSPAMRTFNSCWDIYQSIFWMAEGGKKGGISLFNLHLTRKMLVKCNGNLEVCEYITPEIIAANSKKT